MVIKEGKIKAKGLPKTLANDKEKTKDDKNSKPNQKNTTRWLPA